MFNFSKFFIEKNGPFGEEKCCHFWEMNSFSNTLNRFKKWYFATVRGAFAPGPPAAGAWKPLSGQGVPPEKILAMPLMLRIEVKSWYELNNSKQARRWRKIQKGSVNRVIYRRQYYRENVQLWKSVVTQNFFLGSRSANGRLIKGSP